MLYQILRLTVPPVVRLFIKKVEGIENVPKNKTFIAASNHESYMDHFVIQSVLVKHLKKKMYYLAKKEHFDNFLEKKWHEAVGAIPLDRKSGGKDAIKWALKALQSGKNIGIYPEGTRTLDGKMNQGKTGAVRLALESGVPIVPIGVDGCYELLPKGKRVPKLRFKSITMKIGEPMFFVGKIDDYEYVKLSTQKLMKEIARLANTEYNY